MIDHEAGVAIDRRADFLLVLGRQRFHPHDAALQRMKADIHG
jgi:hypothetical protein